MSRRAISCGVLAAALAFGAGQGCNLIAGLDDVQFEGGGGLGGMGGTTVSSGGGGTTTTTGAMCTDAATDCTDALSAECKMWTCVDGACAEADAAEGANATSQTDGDCKKNVCMAGVATPADDDADPFDDGNECTVDACNAGVPASEPAAASAMCAMDGGKVCDGMGACVECNSNADCTDTMKPVCDMTNTCIEATCNDMILNGSETDVDCGGGCTPCDTAQTCKLAADCFHGVCDAGTMTCTAPTCGDGVQNGGMYLGNDGETDVDCGGPCGPTCGPMKGCDVNGDCVGNQCSGMAGACVPNCADMVKNNVETDIDCGGGTCGGCAVGDDCDFDTDCVSTAFCDMGGKCAAKKPLGGACMGNNQCTSATCADGVCCNSACGGLCQACNIAGNLGSCEFIAVGTDPANECTGNGGNDVCSGNGACAKVDGTTCAGGAECASGNCIDGVCCNTACAGTCKACSAAKTGGMNGVCGDVTAGTDPEMECTASLSCDGAGACQAPFPNGTACTVAGECTSGQCVDGVCCNNSCNGTCQACSMAKKGVGANGTCGPIVTGQDPDNECVLACNGAAACQTNSNGTACGVGGECTSGNCIDGFCCDTTCGASCQACNVMGMEGGCSDAAEGLQDTCMAGQTCVSGACSP